jgi:protein tyrosine phosphatase (PTP) superfamily phosphohydrolase (DUF442 family)
MNRFLPLVSLLFVGCFREPPPGPVRVEVAGLHNVYRLSARLYSGSGPESEAAFASLRGLGVRTVISVDGAAPNLELAHKYGMRYVHVPIGYTGIPDETAWRLTRAATRLPGPVYLHCHHGQHRGPTAAAAIQLCTGAWTPDEAAAWQKMVGTDPRYKGLAGLPKTLHPPPPGKLESLPDDFPEAAKVAHITRAMAEIDQHWDRLKEAKAAGWVAPPGRPDLDPPHEVVLFAEHFRELHRGADPREHRTGFQKMLSEAEVEAGELERALRANPPEKTAADKAFEACRATCAKCHAQHRD